MNIFEIPDLLVLVLKHLPPGEIARCRLVNKKWCDVISNDRGPSGRAFHFWRSSYFSFVEKVMTLRNPYRLLFAQGHGAWNVDFTLDIVRLLSTRFYQRSPKMLVEEGLMTVEQIEAVRQFLSDNTLACFLLDGGVIALREHLVIPEQVVTMRIGCAHLWNLLCHDNGITALREGAITLEQVHNISSSVYVGYLFNNDNGIAALREGLVTPEQVSDLPNYLYVKELLTDNGITALRNRLITPEQIMELDRWQVIHAFIQFQLGKKMKRI